MRVLLVRPSSSDAFIEELYQRLRGELRVHAFAVLEDIDSGAPSSLQTAQALLGRSGADACVLLSQHGEISVVHVWVAAAVRAPVLFEAVAFARTPEAPTILAVRAAGLLTLAFAGANAPSAPAPQAASAAAPASARPPAPPERAADAAAAPPPAQQQPTTTFEVQAGVGLAGQRSGLGDAAGLQLSLRAGKPAGRSHVAVTWAALPFGAGQETSAASVDVVQSFALMELTIVALRRNGWTIDLGAGGGIHYLRATGTIRDGISSLEPGTDFGLAPVASVSAELALAVSARAAVVLAARALVLFPRVSVTVGHDAVDLGTVMPVGGLALRIGL